MCSYLKSLFWFMLMIVTAESLKYFKLWNSYRVILWDLFKSHTKIILQLVVIVVVQYARELLLLYYKSLTTVFIKYKGILLGIHAYC